MKQLKKEMNEIIIRITEEELLQNIKNTEERIMNNTKTQTKNQTNRIDRIIHREINEVINLMQERNELYEVRLVYQLQGETENIEQRKKKLERLLAYEAHSQKGQKRNHIIRELANVINWIEEEQEKYRL